MPFCHCNCYYTHNLYIKSLNKHFTYCNESQFFKDYGETLNALGCSVADKENIMQEIYEEISRRKSVHEKTIERKKLIKANYVPFDIDVYTLKEDFLESSFLKLVEASKCMNYQKIFQIVETLSAEKKIYGFPIFKYEFCSRLLTELNHFEQSSLPKERPNTMNKYGVLLDDLGFHDNFTLPLRQKYLDPLSKILFPEWRGQGLDSHKIFTVSYKSEQDKDLGYHYDNSEVTLNCCLGKKFEGSVLYFGDMKTVPIYQSTCVSISHKVGYGILHRGQQYHGALPLTLGERHNLILWMRSSSIRNSLCPMCNQIPLLVTSQDYGDGFTKSEEIMACDLL